jgi:O-antigen/teichoic acid export membrane protein
MTTKRKSTRGDILKLGVANSINTLLRFMVPVFLVRLIDVNDYGYYRYFWLIANTVIVFTTLGFPRSLLYFLPRSTQSEKKIFINQTILFLTCTAAVAALVFSPWSPILPNKIAELTNEPYIIPSFIFIWVIGSLIEMLPNADQNVSWQSKSIISLAIVRTSLIIGCAALTHDIELIYIAIIVFALLQVFLLLYYSTRYHGFISFRIKRETLSEQLRYAIPFGMSDILFKFRMISAQWIVALLFSTNAFAVFSIALNTFSLSSLVRLTVTRVVTPKMSQSEAKGEKDVMIAMNNKANIMISFILVPLSFFIFVFADDIISVLYTSAYIEATIILRIYMISLLLDAVSVASVLMVLRQGHFVMKVNTFSFIFSPIAVYVGAVFLGLPGVAIATLIATIFEKILNFRRACKLLEIPFRELQPWGTISSIFVASISSAFIIFGFDQVFLIDNFNLLQITAGGLLFGLTYLSFICLLKQGWIVAIVLGKRSF